MRTRTLMLSGLTLLAVACGSADSKDKDPVNKNVDEFGLVGTGAASADNDGLTGEGDVVFNKSLGSVESGSRFEIKFSLADDAELSVVTYASKALNGGIEFAFKRHGDHLDAEILSGGKFAEITEQLEGLNVAGTIGLAIEVHNDEAPAHVIIENLANDTALVNSEEGHDHDHEGDEHEGHDHEGDEHESHDHEGEESEELVNANGTGNFWGLRLQDGVVVKAARAAAPESGH